MHTQSVVLFVVITLLGLLLCVQASDVTLEENPDAKTVHPFVLEALVSKICADNCLGKGLQIRPYVAKCNQHASADECRTAFNRRRSEQEIRDDDEDGPVYAHYLREYIKNQVVVEPEDNHLDDDIFLDVDLTLADVPGRPAGQIENKPELPSVSFLGMFVIALVIIAASLYFYIDQDSFWRAKNAIQKARRKAVEKQSAEKIDELQKQLDQAQKQIKSLEERPERQQSEEVTIVEPQSLRERLINLTPEQLCKLGEGLELSQQHMKMVFQNRKLHRTRVTNIMKNCGLTEDFITDFLDTFEKEKQKALIAFSPIDESGRDHGDGWGGAFVQFGRREAASGFAPRLQALQAPAAPAGAAAAAATTAAAAAAATPVTPATATPVTPAAPADAAAAAATTAAAAATTAAAAAEAPGEKRKNLSDASDLSDASELPQRDASDLSNASKRARTFRCMEAD